MAKIVKAVIITSDIVSSAKLSSVKRKKLQSKLLVFISATGSEYPDFKAEQYRGDSLQCIITKNKTAALRIALSLYCFLAADNIKIRQSIGAGDISFNSSKIVTSDGTAFRLSGENIDALKKRNELIAVTSAEKNFTDEWEVHSASLNFLLERLSSAQAEAVYLQLQNTRQEDIARQLKISQPSVHQRLQAAGWYVINKILQRFEATITTV